MVHIVKKRGPVRANHNRGWPRDVQTGEAPRELPRAAGCADRLLSRPLLTASTTHSSRLAGIHTRSKARKVTRGD